MKKERAVFVNRPVNTNIEKKNYLIREFSEKTAGTLAKLRRHPKTSNL
jgi:hypothetical protein